jgi:hypothetical protein
MAQQTTMTIYQDVVLECQHCYTICRYTDAVVRRHCPACGLAIANWEALTESIHAMRQQEATPARQSRDTA